MHTPIWMAYQPIARTLFVLLWGQMDLPTFPSSLFFKSNLIFYFSMANDDFLILSYTLNPCVDYLLRLLSDAICFHKPLFLFRFLLCYIIFEAIDVKLIYATHWIWCRLDYSAYYLMPSLFPNNFIHFFDIIICNLLTVEILWCEKADGRTEPDAVLNVCTIPPFGMPLRYSF